MVIINKVCDDRQVMNGRRFPRRHFDTSNSTGVALAVNLRCSLKEVRCRSIDPHPFACAQTTEGGICSPQPPSVRRGLSGTERHLSRFVGRALSGALCRAGTVGETERPLSAFSQVMEFFNSSRKHIKEALVPACSQIHSPISQITQDSIIIILLGLALTPSQFLPLENSTLAQVRHNTFTHVRRTEPRSPADGLRHPFHWVLYTRTVHEHWALALSPGADRGARVHGDACGAGLEDQRRRAERIQRRRG
jgi:hypothetical protein